MVVEGGDVAPQRTGSRMLLRVLGWLIVLASLVFLGQRIWVSRLWTLDDIAIGAAIGVLAAGAVAYGLNCLLLSTAWCAWLRWASESSAPLRVCHGVYGRTQIAKYLPGNVFHFAGRHVVGRNAGFGHKSLVAAALMEVLALVSAAAVLAVGGLGWFGWQRAAAGFHPALAGAGVVILIVMPLLASVLARRLPGSLRLETHVRATGWRRLRLFLRPYVWTLLFMAVAGGLFVAVTRIGVVADDIAPAPLIVGVFAFAWLAGFIVPGASGGLGVREAAMVVPLSPYMGEAAAIAAALIMRMVTIGGDLVYFGLAHAFPTTADLPNDATESDDAG